MEMATPVAARKTSFRHPKRYFSDVDPALAAVMVSSGVDVALIVENGVIKDLALGNPELVEAGCDEAWRGAPWLETVTPDSRKKVEDLLRVNPEDAGRWRQVTQNTLSGAPIPIKYTTVRTGNPDQILALGQDLRSIATLQQRLVAMHQDLEREYASLRDIETRYRSLFDALSENVIIVSVSDGRVAEMNPAAKRRLGLTETDPRGSRLFDYIEPDDHTAVQRMIDRALTNGRGEAGDVALRARGTATLRATAFRQDNEIYVIIRIDPDGSLPVSAVDPVAMADIQQVMQRLPDGLVITTSTFRVLSANATFLRMVQATEERQVIGEQLSNWLGRSPSDVSMLQSSLRRHGVARNFATAVRDRLGAEDEVEVSAVAAELDDETVYGFAIRPTSRRLGARGEGNGWARAGSEDVTALVGQMPLKDIVRSSTDHIEKQCIEAALELADQSRASAAEILGLSRQGLYSKLKRFKIPQND